MDGKGIWKQRRKRGRESNECEKEEEKGRRRGDEEVEKEMSLRHTRRNN